MTKKPFLTLYLAHEADTRRLADDLAAILRTGDIIALSGDLGAGKSTLARALIRQLAGQQELEVPSPTYTLSQIYETSPKVTHFDLYRLGDEAELTELGFEEAAETGIVLVEWPERADQVMEEANLCLALAITDDGGRMAELYPTPELAVRLERSLIIRDFLDRAGYGGAHRMPFPADASARRYERIGFDGVTTVLMDAPATSSGPAIRNGRSYAEIAHIAQNVRPFAGLADLLQAKGFAAPRVLAADIPGGILLLSDLGHEGILTEAGEPIKERYRASAETLAALHAENFTGLHKNRFGFEWTIPPFDLPALAIETELLIDWFWPRIHGEQISEGRRAEFGFVWAQLFERLKQARSSLVLRDFHSPNILWQPQETGSRRVGLLDFQDCMIGPAAYDLASLAQDARVDISPALEESVITAYLAAAQRLDPTLDADALRAEYAIMAAQRATKLLGIFVRLHERDGKPQYLRHIPRIQNYLTRSLAHPVNADLRTLYDQWGITSPISTDKTGI